MKLFGYGLMIGSIIFGALVDKYKYPNIEVGVFTSFVLFLLGVYILILDDKKKI